MATTPIEVVAAAMDTVPDVQAPAVNAPPPMLDVVPEYSTGVVHTDGAASHTSFTPSVWMIVAHELFDP